MSAEGRVASLAMYDADRGAVRAWWRGIAGALRARGVGGVPDEPAWPADHAAHWRDPRLLLGQTCGYPLVTGLSRAVQVVGAFRYTAPGCDGICYRSALVVRSDEAGRSVEDFRDRVAAINDPASHSGCNALRALVAPLCVDGRFFSRMAVSGSHRRSLEQVRAGEADIAAIDCVSLAALRRAEPGLLAGLRAIGHTEAAPGLPLVTAAGTPPPELAALREALAAACVDPRLADARRRLDIGGFEIVPSSAWQVVDEMRRVAEPPAGRRAGHAPIRA